MTRRALIEVMIIVPPIAECEQRHEDVVSTPIRTLETTRAEKMTNRVCAVDGVVNEHSAYEEPPREHLKS